MSHLIPLAAALLAGSAPAVAQLEFRTIDGTGNNPIVAELNAANTPLRRRIASDYADGISQLGGSNRPNPRAISNAVAAQDKPVYNALGMSDFVWQWGQFLDHDIDLTTEGDPRERADIAIPAGDPEFDPDKTGTVVMAMSRSAYEPSSGTGPNNPREQMNAITGWIDASNVYGSDAVRAAALRTNDGTGRLKTSDGDLLPFNEFGLANAGGPSPQMFVAGDVRANEQVGLTALHTLFMREHNRLAGEIAAADPTLDGDEIYERARSIVGAQMQVITYNEFLPALLGDRALSPYRGYRRHADAAIMNVFSTAAFRLGHSLLSPQMLRLDANGDEIDAGHLALREAFFAPQQIAAHGIDPILRGLAAQRCQEVDVFVVDDVRNFLFGAPGGGGFDLPSLNIQRGRDHGLPSYNVARTQLGLAPRGSFEEISSTPEVVARLKSVYANVDDVDLWIGGLAEDHVPGAGVGETIRTVLVLQFTSLRDGDRFWYEWALPRAHKEAVARVRLSDIIRRNTDIGAEIPDDVFSAATRRGKPRPSMDASQSNRSQGRGARFDGSRDDRSRAVPTRADARSRAGRDGKDTRRGTTRG